jgi:hypothetical protein
LTVKALLLGELDYLKQQKFFVMPYKQKRPFGLDVYRLAIEI